MFIYIYIHSYMKNFLSSNYIDQNIVQLILDSKLWNIYYL